MKFNRIKKASLFEAFFYIFEKNLCNMKKLVLCIFMLAGILSFQSCQYEWIDPIDTVIPDVVSFAGDIQPIFDRSCNSTGCHATGGIAPDLTPANAYSDLFAKSQIDVANPANSKLYMKCADGGSMAKFTKPGDADLILKWIEQGALSN